jgi:FdhD protein
MLGKAAKMGVPIVISRTSPTSLSVKLARAANMTLIGYARTNSFRIYAAPERVLVGAPTKMPAGTVPQRQSLSMATADED